MISRSPRVFVMMMMISSDDIFVVGFPRLADEEEYDAKEKT